VWFMTCTTGHDAFRRASGTLSPAYPLFALLRRQATDLDDLARWLGRPHKTVQRHAKLLVQAGVASWCPEGLQLVPGQPQAALTAVARGAGTDGTRVRAYRKYLQACDEWAVSRAEWLSEYVVGSDAWIAYTFKETLEVFRSPTCSALRDVACQEGDRLLEDVAMDVVIAEAERHRRRGPLSNHGRPSIVAPTHGMDH